MTKEEFNKLPKQEKVNLVWDKIGKVFSCTSDNMTRHKINLYARLHEEDEWQLVCTNSIQSDWFSEITEKFFPNARVVTIGYVGERKSFLKRDSLYSGMDLIDNNDIPDDFLEYAIFKEVPQGNESDKYLDKFDSAVYLTPSIVYNMAKQIPMEMHKYVELSRELGYWATKGDVATHRLKNIANGLGDDINKVIEAYSRRNKKRKQNIFIFSAIVVILAIIFLMR